MANSKWVTVKGKHIEVNKSDGKPVKSTGSLSKKDKLNNRKSTKNN